VETLRTTTTTLFYYETEMKALEDIVNGKIWGYLSISENFTDSIYDRYFGAANETTNDTIIGSQLRFKMDQSSKTLICICCLYLSINFH
jgi:hypothetical protein